MKRCPMCRAHISPADENCGKCGFVLLEKKETIKKEPEVHKAAEEQPKSRHDFQPKEGLSSQKKLIIGIVLIITMVAAGAIFFASKAGILSLENFIPEKKGVEIKEEIVIAGNNTSAENETPAPVVEENITTVVEKSPEAQMYEYLKVNTPAIFPSFDNRIIEIEFVGNKSVLRFRVSTANSAQESLYLLGAQFLAFPNISIANATGYNSEGKIIQSPDSRTQDTRARYWRKYHAKTDWFPNANIPPECKADAGCNDNNLCTKDQCLKDGFCSNVIVVSQECPGIS
ncbi:TPA: hypothetical protein H1009_02215 [archaeon]|nr:hypothetical protein [Candidatus Naiadarchaeales archaeon SRR2090153.bin461]